MSRGFWLLLFLALAEPAAAQETASLPADAGGRALLVSVVVSAADTPDQKSYLATAWAEAGYARSRLEEAVETENDPARLKQKVAEAMHAIDPLYGVAGKGSSYGMRPALAKAAAALRDAAKLSPRDPRLNEAVSCILAAEAQLDDAVDFGRASQVTPSRGVARQAARGMLMALDRATDGWDRDGDGAIEWQRGEGGLRQADQAADSLAHGLALR